MKKYYIIVALILSGISGYSQQGFHAGLNGGGGLVFIVYQNAYGGTEHVYAPKGGYMFGGEVGYNFTDHFGLQTELNYTRQGQNYTDLANNVNYDRFVTLNYVQIPVMIKFSGGNYPSRINVMFGPQWGILTNATITDKNEGVTTTVNAKDKFTNYDLGLAGEIGSDFTLYKNLYMSTGLRLTYSINDINAPAFRNLEPDKRYHPSKNAYGMVLIGLHYLCK